MGGEENRKAVRAQAREHQSALIRQTSREKPRFCGPCGFTAGGARGRARLSRAPQPGSGLSQGGEEQLFSRARCRHVATGIAVPQPVLTLPCPRHGGGPVLHIRFVTSPTVGSV